jgi:hypothetical protein
MTVASCHGTGRSVERSGRISKSPVAPLPARHRVALDRVHVDVDREQVVARLGSVLRDSGEEVLRCEALAHEAPLHVGQAQQHRVHRAVLRRAAELLERHGGRS